MSNANLERDIININPYNLKIDTGKFKQTTLDGNGPNYGNGQLTWTFVKQGSVIFQQDNTYTKVLVSDDNCWGIDGNGIVKVHFKIRMLENASGAEIRCQFLSGENDTPLAGNSYNYLATPADTSAPIFLKAANTTGSGVRYGNPCITMNYNAAIDTQVTDTIATVSAETYITWVDNTGPEVNYGYNPFTYYTGATTSKISDIRGFQIASNHADVLDYVEWVIWRLA